jgi:hypothetical protein
LTIIMMMATPRAASTSQNLLTFLSVRGSSTVFPDHTPTAGLRDRRRMG